METRRYRTSYEPISAITFYGSLHQIDFDGYRFLFDLEGRIKWIAPLKADLWPGPENYLRRTLGNKWLLYESGAYAGVYELTGRYYLPVPLAGPWSPWQDMRAGEKLSRLTNLLEEASQAYPVAGARQLNFLARQLAGILKGTVPVLPPDAIKAEYDLIPLFVSRGCVHNCSFCSVKAGGDLEIVSDNELKCQIKEMKSFLGADMANYNSVFLGQNDALAAGAARAAETASLAYDSFGIGSSIMQGTNLFLFGSVRSLLMHGLDDLLELDKIPYSKVFINLGLESFHENTLERLGKPLSSLEVLQAFDKGLELARRGRKLNVSFNFVIGKDLPNGHLQTMEKYLSSISLPPDRCTIYISPLQHEKWRPGELMRQVMHLKAKSRLRLHLYCIVPL